MAEEDLQTKIKKDIQSATQALATLTKSKLESISKELTQSEYDELSEEEKNNGTVYYITDTEEVPQTKIIDDNVKTDNTTWSSEKIDTTLNGALASSFIGINTNNKLREVYIDNGYWDNQEDYTGWLVIDYWLSASNECKVYIDNVLIINDYRGAGAPIERRQVVLPFKAGQVLMTSGGVVGSNGKTITFYGRN